MTLAEILKDSYYKLTQFNLVEINNLEKRIIKRTNLTLFSWKRSTSARTSKPSGNIQKLRLF